jgi:hypothetical protein
MVTMMMMWYEFSMQRGPVEKMKEMITDMEQMMYENGRRKGSRKQNLRGPYAIPHQDMDQPTSTGHETHIRPNITQHT